MVKRDMTTKKLTLLAVIIALCVVGRVVFVFIPNVQPVTAIIILSSFFMGPVFGFLLAVGSAVITNLFLGSGVWTLFQIVAWGCIGFLTGGIGKLFPNTNRYVLAAIGGVLGYVYGAIVSLNMLLFANNYWAYYLAGLPFDTAHAIGNVAFVLLLYPFLKWSFKEYRKTNYEELS
ncbi:substrate-specific component CbrT of predicted cobalamin ECF transporter [Geomicrobium sp. JCM 19037]|nr:substrate-specific component CbrT of predicted cobalamin ECF transporter [Geomicrobium sp. JCM 19037]